MKKLELFLMLFLPICSLAQRDNVKLLVDNGKYVESDWARQIALTSNDSIAIVNDFADGLRLFDLNTGTLINGFEGHSLEGDLYYDPAQQWLLTTGDRKMRIWDIARQKLLKEIKQPFHSQFMNDVYVDSRHRFVFAQYTKYDFTTLQKVRSYNFQRMYFFRDNYYVLDFENGRFFRYDVYSDKQLGIINIENYHKGYNLFFNENKGYLFIGFSDGVFAVDITTGKSIPMAFDRSQTFSNLGITNNFEFSYDRQFFIATSNQGKNNLTGQGGHLVVLKKFPGKGGEDLYLEIYRDSMVFNEVVALNHSNKVLVTRQNSFELIDLEKLTLGQGLVWRNANAGIREPQRLKLELDGKEALDVKTDGKRMHVNEVRQAMGNAFSEKVARNYFLVDPYADFEKGLGYCEFRDDVDLTTLPPDLKELSRFAGRYIRLQNHKGYFSNLSGSAYRAVPAYGTQNSPYDPVAGKNFSPSGKVYAVEKSFGNVMFFNAGIGALLVSATNTGVTYHIEYSRDEKYAAFGGSDRKVTIVDLVNKKVLHSVYGNSYITSISFSSDNKYVFSGSLKNEIQMFDRVTGKLLRKFTGSNGSILDLEVSKNGILLYSIAEDGALRVWNTASGNLLLNVYFDAEMNFLAFTPNGYFDKSEHFSGKVFFNVDGQPYAFDQLYEKFYRPDIILSLLGGNDSNFKKEGTDLSKLKSPPQLKILRLNEDTRGAVMGKAATEEELSLKIIATDKGGGIRGIRVFNNRKLIEEKMFDQTVFRDSVVISIRFQPANGENLIEAVGIAEDYTESGPVSLKVEARKKAGANVKVNLYVLAVGINEYKNSRYTLNYCVADMESFSDSLKEVAGALFGTIQIRKFSNNDATRENILNSLALFSKQIQPEDVFLFYYAGHGIALGNSGNPEFFFVLNPVTQMSDPENCRKYGLTGSEMKEQVKQIKASKQLMFIDACNSGAMAADFVMRGAAEENAIAKLSRSTGSAVFSSTTDEQNASEFRQIRHGAFTYVLLNAFSGGASAENCQITVSGLKAYIDDQVPVVTEKYKGTSQFPTTFIFGQDFPVGFRCKR